MFCQVCLLVDIVKIVWCAIYKAKCHLLEYTIVERKKKMVATSNAYTIQNHLIIVWQKKTHAVAHKFEPIFKISYVSFCWLIVAFNHVVSTQTQWISIFSVWVCILLVNSFRLLLFFFSIESGLSLKWILIKFELRDVEICE